MEVRLLTCLAAGALLFSPANVFANTPEDPVGTSEAAVTDSGSVVDEIPMDYDHYVEPGEVNRKPAVLGPALVELPDPATLEGEIGPLPEEDLQPVSNQR